MKMLTTEEHRALLQRIAGLEREVTKMQWVFGGIVDLINAAQSMTASCSECGIDLTEGVLCSVQNCPNGLGGE